MWCPSNKAKTISLILVIAMLWHSAGLSLYAQVRSIQSQQEKERSRREALKAPDSRFDKLLGQLKEVVKRGAEKTKAASEKGFANIEQLTTLKEELIAGNEKNRTYFGQVEETIRAKGLSPEILNRHQEFVRNYEGKYQTLLNDLEAIESVHQNATGLWGRITGKNQSVEWDGVVARMLDFLEANTSAPRKYTFDPRNLPHRSLRADKPIPPKLTREEWDIALAADFADSTDSKNAAKASEQNSSAFQRGQKGPRLQSPSALGTAPPTPADLAETIEVKFTPEIRQVALSLENNPVKIFNWVRNNIEFVPTWGSIQGAQLCLETRICNAFDTSSLLIALLRVSGIPARYQMGTIEVPVEKFKNWAGGFTDADAAASLFASVGVPSVIRRVDQSGVAVSVKLEHVWVKVFADHAPSGGTVNLQGDAWLSLDPSFKQYTFPTPVDLSQFIHVNNASTFLDQVLATATTNQQTGEVARLDLPLAESTLQPDEAAVANYVKTNFGQKSVQEIIGTGSIITRELPVLPAGLPYRLTIAGAGFAEVPATLRHRLELTITNSSGAVVLSFAQSLPELSGGRIVLGYTPASDVDRQAISALIPTDPTQSLGTLPATFINLSPELRINNQPVANGSAARLGAPQVMEMRFTAPTIQTPSVVNAISVGESFAIALDLQQISNDRTTALKSRLTEIANEVRSTPTNFSPLEVQGLILNSVALGWFKEVDFVNQLAAQISGVATLRYPSSGMACSSLVPSTSFGSVTGVALGGIAMDVDRDTIAAVAKDGNSLRTINYGLVTGVIGSMLEGTVPTQVSRALHDSGRHYLATTSSLGVAQTRGGTVVALNPNNFPLVSSRLGVTAADLGDFEDALNAGMRVMVHERELVNASGGRYLGYLAFDPSTGSGAYILGGAGGSREVRSCLSSQPPTAQQDSFLDLLGGFVFEQAKSALLDRLGVGHLVSNLESIGSLIQGVMDNLGRLNTATSAAPNLQLQPLMGLVVLLAALDALKELASRLLPPGLAQAATAYIGLVAGVAWRMVEIQIVHFLVIDAAIQGIEIPPDCVLNLAP